MVRRVQGRSLNLPGLVGDANCSANIIRCVPVHRKLPNVELHALAADHDATLAVYVRVLVPGLTKRKLLRSASGF